MSKRFVLALFSVGILGLATVTLPSYAAHEIFLQSKTNTQVNSAFNSSAASLRLNLNVLLRAHTVVGAVMLSRLYEGKSTTQLQNLMSDNGDKITAIIQKNYGVVTGAQFSKLWTQHMQEYQNYTVAKKNNDTAAMNTARTNLHNIATQMGDLLGKASNNMSSQTITSLMKAHVDGTLAFVDATAAGDQTAAANLLRQGYDQAGQFADTLARGILLDKPQQYQ